MYETPAVDIRDFAVTEEFIPIFIGGAALAAIGVIGVLATICTIQGGRLYWGFNTFWGIPTSIWYECRR
jgi:hypothetical protein